MTLTKDRGTPINLHKYIEGLTLDKKKMIIGDTSSSSKKVLLKALKYPSSTSQVYKERNSVGLSLNTLKSNQRYSSEHQILFHNSHLNSCSCKSQILA